MNTLRTTSCIVSLVAAVLLTARPSPAQEEAPADSAASSVSVGLRIGYAWPVGDWERHRFAPVDQFSPGLAFGGDLEIRTGPRGGIAILVEHMPLDVTAWEDYAVSRGSVVDASASITHIGLALRTFLLDPERSPLRLDLGALVALQSGKETSGQYSYEYDFLRNPAFGAFLALEYVYFISPNVGVTARASMAFVFSGVKYADGVEYIVMLAPVTGGLRFYL